jgi:hypothetical protein
MLREKIVSAIETLADTPVGTAIFQLANDIAFALSRILRRMTSVRLLFDRIFQRPLAASVQFLKNLFRPNLRLKIAEERPSPDEGDTIREIIEVFRQNMLRRYITRRAERGANAKTYGAVRADFTVLPNLPSRLAQGVFREPKTQQNVSTWTKIVIYQKLTVDNPTCVECVPRFREPPFPSGQRARARFRLRHSTPRH